MKLRISFPSVTTTRYSGIHIGKRGSTSRSKKLKGSDVLIEMVVGSVVYRAATPSTDIFSRNGPADSHTKRFPLVRPSPPATCRLRSRPPVTAISPDIQPEFHSTTISLRTGDRSGVSVIENCTAE